MPIKLIPQKTNFAFTNKRRFSIAFSAIMIIATIALLLTKGLNYGIDFTGGILVEIKTEQAIDMAKLRDSLHDASTLQQLEGDNEVMIRLPLNHEKKNEQVVAELKETLGKSISGEIEYRKIDYVGPQVGKELIETAIYAMLAAFGTLLIYVWLRFEWQYGVGAILALMHDTIAVLGFYALTGVEFDLTSVAALLTVIGYSINDSVVIYDRVRENVRKFKKMALNELIDLSVNETLSRTILTGGTVILSVSCMIFFGGPILQSFSLGMLFGVIIGTYSSIYVSALLLLYFDPRKSDNEENKVYA